MAKEKKMRTFESKVRMDESEAPPNKRQNISQQSGQPKARPRCKLLQRRACADAT